MLKINLTNGKATIYGVEVTTTKGANGKAVRAYIKVNNNQYHGDGNTVVEALKSAAARTGLRIA